MVDWIDGERCERGWIGERSGCTSRATIESESGDLVCAEHAIVDAVIHARCGVIEALDGIAQALDDIETLLMGAAWSRQPMLYRIVCRVRHWICG